jgi:hypothetical protein
LKASLAIMNDLDSIDKDSDKDGKIKSEIWKLQDAVAVRLNTVHSRQGCRLTGRLGSPPLRLYAT